MGKLFVQKSVGAFTVRKTLFGFAALGMVSVIFGMLLIHIRAGLALGYESPVDFRWAYAAVHMLANGGDPYSAAYAAQLVGDPKHSPFPYPLFSLWYVIPFMLFPLDVAATLWTLLLISTVIVLEPLYRGTFSFWRAMLTLASFTFLIAVENTQWSLPQMLVLGLCVALFC